MKGERTVVHCLAVCLRCKWSSEDYKRAQRLGRQHAERTGHAVTVETGTVVDYNLTDKSKEKL